MDVLINNAAVMRCPPGKTEDGFDMQLGVNYLGKSAALNYIIITALLWHDCNLM